MKWISGIHILRGRVQIPHAGAELGLAKLADVELAIAAVPDQVLRVYGLYVLGDRSREDTLRQIRELGWGELSEKGLWTTVKRGRRVLSWELFRRDLLEGGVERMRV